MKKDLFRLQLGFLFTFCVYSALYGQTLSNALIVLFLASHNIAHYWIKQKTSMVTSGNPEIEQLKDDLEIENLKITIDRLKTQSIADKAKRDILQSEGKNAPSGFMF